MIDQLRRLAGDALRATDFDAKSSFLDDMCELLATRAEAGDPADGACTPDGDPNRVVAFEAVDAAAVGLPVRVRLVAPRELPRRTWGKPEGRAATIHALTHIEANAVNLALDAVHRFGPMPLDYYRDWTCVAVEELGHFRLLCGRLAEHGLAYGDLPCHGGLWDVAAKTTHSVLARMALVPMVFEARGLDVTPGIVDRFERHGDSATADALRIVLRDEIGHVEVGVRWFRYLCRADGLDVWAEFNALVESAGLMVVPPFNAKARVASGFPRELLDEWAERFVGRAGA